MPERVLPGVDGGVVAVGDEKEDLSGDCVRRPSCVVNRENMR